MRISDWSSDVCSSDLDLPDEGRFRAAARPEDFGKLRLVQNAERGGDNLGFRRLIEFQRRTGQHAQGRFLARGGGQGRQALQKPGDRLDEGRVGKGGGRKSSFRWWTGPKKTKNK